MNFKLGIIFIFMLFQVNLASANSSHDQFCSYKDQKTADANQGILLEPTYPGFYTEVSSVRKGNNSLYYIVNATNLTSGRHEFGLYSWDCKKKKAKLLYMFNTTKYQAYTLLSFDGRFAVYSNLSMGQDDSVLATMGILDLKQTWKDKHVFFGASAVYRDGKSTYNLTPSRFTRDQAIYVRFTNFRWPSVGYGQVYIDAVDANSVLSSGWYTYNLFHKTFTKVE